MDVLRKIKAGTLIETLVASVILLLIFGIASVIISNIYKVTLSNNNTLIAYELDKLTYRYINNDLKLPYAESYDYFDIYVSAQKNTIGFEVVAQHGNKVLENRIYNALGDEK